MSFNTPEMRASFARVYAAYLGGVSLTLGTEPFLDFCREWLIARHDPRWDGEAIRNIDGVCLDLYADLSTQSEP